MKQLTKVNRMKKTPSQTSPANPSKKTRNTGPVLARVVETYDTENIYVHENTLRGVFCRWAVSQHPYHRPPRLFMACECFIKFLAPHDAGGCCLSLHVLKIKRKKLRKLITEFCNQNLAVRAWNVPRVAKRGRIGKEGFVFLTRYGGPAAKHDFIDLDALAGNIYRQLEQESSD